MKSLTRVPRRRCESVSPSPLPGADLILINSTSIIVIRNLRNFLSVANPANFEQVDSRTRIVKIVFSIKNNSKGGSMTKYRFEQFAATRLYTGAIAYSPDGTQIAHVNNVTGQFNLWMIPSGGGMPRQLTSYSDNTVRSISWRPDGKELIFIADQNGDEQNQVYTIGSQGGWPEALTNKMDAQHLIG